MKKLSQQDLDALEIGTAILGSGGGGDPAVEKLAAQVQLDKYGPVRIITLDELKDEDLVVPVGFMGAPSVGVEMLPSGIEFTRIFEAMEKYIAKKPTVLMAAEIGGSNAFVPFIVAAQRKLPVLDADGIGRAFPELQMSSFNLSRVSPSPAFIADTLGNVIAIDLIGSPNDAATLENIARNVTVSFGSSAAIAVNLMSGAQARNAVVAGSVSRARRMGEIILGARRAAQDPLKALVSAFHGSILACGNIEDIDQKLEGGFLKGNVVVASTEGRLVINYQNEHLAVLKNESPIACTPDIIMLLDAENATPIPVEKLCYGLRVCVVALPGPDIWKTSRGLKLVGPRAFGYDFDYFSFGEVR